MNTVRNIDLAQSLEITSIRSRLSRSSGKAIGSIAMAGMVTVLSATAAFAGAPGGPHTFYGNWNDQYTTGAETFRAGSMLTSHIGISIDGQAQYPLTISLQGIQAQFPYSTSTGNHGGANCNSGTMTMMMPDSQLTLSGPDAGHGQGGPQDNWSVIATGASNWPTGANEEICTGDTAPSITVQHVYASDPSARIDITWNYVGTDDNGSQTSDQYAPHDHVYGGPLAVVPEAPAAALLPITALAALGAGYAIWRRRVSSMGVR